ncbi:MAG TPA: hypothetical protein VFL57_06240 [Bryobacteraceae bacterium]|nr:hypothetical protein [Bryobacteraceae bacterium]
MKDTARQLLRHTLATLAYRAGKVLRGIPADFPNFRVSAGTRTPGEILAHMCDLFDWAFSLARGKHVWHDSQPAEWSQDVARFHTALAAFDDLLASADTLACAPEQLFQGPVADALTHIGQIALLRRIAGSPVRGENYFAAEIVAGRVGPQQTAPRREFD